MSGRKVVSGSASSAFGSTRHRVQVHLNAEQFEAIQKAAAAAGVSMSDAVRQALIQKCGLPPDTTAAIRFDK